MNNYDSQGPAGLANRSTGFGQADIRPPVINMAEGLDRTEGALTRSHMLLYQIEDAMAGSYPSPGVEPAAQANGACHRVHMIGLSAESIADRLGTLLGMVERQGPATAGRLG